MKILAVSDQVVPQIYSATVCQRYGDVELVLGCGDLPYSYLEYIVTKLNVPCFFVHGNHDKPEYTSGGSVLQEPGGWVNIDERTIRFKDLILGGLEGSIRYKPGAPYQYTETGMALKIARMIPSLVWNRLFRGRYLDILITHSPLFGIHDDDDLAHMGFKTLRWFLERFRPRYMLHGHQHIYTPQAYQTWYLETEIINVFPYHLLEWQPEQTAAP